MKKVRRRVECRVTSGEAEKNMKRKITVLTLCAMLLALCGSADGAAAEESPSDRVSIGGRSSYVSPPVPRQFGWLCASLAT